MARFDVYAHPDAALRRATPFLVDVQNNYIDRIATRVVVPMRPAATFGPPMRDLNPVFKIEGKPMVLDTAAIAAFPAAGLSRPVASLQRESATITSALDTLFGSY